MPLFSSQPTITDAARHAIVNITHAGRAVSQCFLILPLFSLLLIAAAPRLSARRRRKASDTYQRDAGAAAAGREASCLYRHFSGHLVHGSR